MIIHMYTHIYIYIYICIYIYGMFLENMQVFYLSSGQYQIIDVLFGTAQKMHKIHIFQKTNVWGSVMFFFFFFKEVSYAHQGCFYLVKKKKKNYELKIEIFLQFKTTVFYFYTF